jgi:hypothetical protein
VQTPTVLGGHGRAPAKISKNIREPKGAPSIPELAVATVCIMFGALMVSRLLDSEELSDRVLADARAYILSLAE